MMVCEAMRAANEKMTDLEQARIEAHVTLREAEEAKARVFDDAGKMVCKMREEAESVVRQAVEERRIAYEAEFKEAVQAQKRASEEALEKAQ